MRWILNEGVRFVWLNCKQWELCIRAIFTSPSILEVLACHVVVPFGLVVGILEMFFLEAFFILLSLLFDS